MPIEASAMAWKAHLQCQHYALSWNISTVLLQVTKTNVRVFAEDILCKTDATIKTLGVTDVTHKYSIAVWNVFWEAVTFEHQFNCQLVWKDTESYFRLVDLRFCFILFYVCWSKTKECWRLRKRKTIRRKENTFYCKFLYITKVSFLSHETFCAMLIKYIIFIPSPLLYLSSQKMNRK